MYLQSEIQKSAPILSDPLPWYAIWTKSNQEKLSSKILGNKGFEVYFPAYRVRRRWSDRTVETEMPFFPGYFFCRLDVIKRMPVLATPGVVGIVGFSDEPVPIPEHEIEAVQAVLRSSRRAEPYPFLREGQRVRIRRGAFEGVEGILVKEKSEWLIVISISILQRSVSVEIDRNEVMTV